jgi:hypothetical protein
MIAHEITGSPVSGFFHLSHKPAKLSTPPSAAPMKYGCLPVRHLEPLGHCATAAPRINLEFRSSLLNLNRRYTRFTTHSSPEDAEAPHGGSMGGHVRPFFCLRVPNLARRRLSRSVQIRWLPPLIQCWPEQIRKGRDQLSRQGLFPG